MINHQPRRLGSGGPRVFPLGAAWACSTCTARLDESESIATIHAALDAGITLLDEHQMGVLASER